MGVCVCIMWSCWHLHPQPMPLSMTLSVSLSEVHNIQASVGVCICDSNSAHAGFSFCKNSTPPRSLCPTVSILYPWWFLWHKHSTQITGCVCVYSVSVMVSVTQTQHPGRWVCLCLFRVRDGFFDRNTAPRPLCSTVSILCPWWFLWLKRKTQAAGCVCVYSVSIPWPWWFSVTEIRNQVTGVSEFCLHMCLCS